MILSSSKSVTDPMPVVPSDWVWLRGERGVVVFLNSGWLRLADKTCRLGRQARSAQPQGVPAGVPADKLAHFLFKQWLLVCNANNLLIIWLWFEILPHSTLSESTGFLFVCTRSCCWDQIPTFYWTFKAVMKCLWMLDRSHGNTILKHQTVPCALLFVDRRQWRGEITQHRRAMADFKGTERIKHCCCEWIKWPLGKETTSMNSYHFITSSTLASVTWLIWWHQV